MGIDRTVVECLSVPVIVDYILIEPGFLHHVDVSIGPSMIFGFNEVLTPAKSANTFPFTSGVPEPCESSISIGDPSLLMIKLGCPR